MYNNGIGVIYPLRKLLEDGAEPLFALVLIFHTATLSHGINK